MAEVLAARNGDGGWGYAAGRDSTTEATAVCTLALLALQLENPAIEPALSFLEARRLPGGAFATSVAVPEPSWATPLAAAAMGKAGISDAVHAAEACLLAAEAFVPPSMPAGLYGFDTSIPGWPWTTGDYSFVEPTAAAVIFLKRQGHSQHPRIRQAVSMLRERAILTGGWNYGEPVVLGSELFPAIVPTAFALLALADEPDAITAAGLNWLAQQRDTITTPFSLGWAGMALNVWGLLDESWAAGLADTWHASPEARRGPMDTALCLLAVAPPESHPFNVLVE